MMRFLLSPFVRLVFVWIELGEISHGVYFSGIRLHDQGHAGIRPVFSTCFFK